MLGSLVTLLTSGAGGGIIGGVMGLCRQSGERKERLALAELELKRDELELTGERENRAHQLTMLEKGAEIELETVKTETEAEIDVSNQQALFKAQDTFKHLQTSAFMDNMRASVRPVLAYWIMLLFTAFLSWAFMKFAPQITATMGGELLEQLLLTLIFMATSITSFYYVSRRNPKS